MKEIYGLSGVVIPMITPFSSKGKVSFKDTAKVAKSLIDEEVSLLLLGTTGEALSIPNSERIRFVEAVMEVKSAKSYVIGGISHLSFNRSVYLAQHFFDLGVDAVAAHLPTYYPLTDQQIKSYYEHLADQVTGPLFIYNIPQTVHMSVPLDLVEDLSHHPNICGIKDSEHSLERLESAINLWNKRTDFIHLTGWASKSKSAILAGSDGIVPATGNFVPTLYKELYKAAHKNDEKKADQLQKETNGLSLLYRNNRNLSQSIAALKVVMEHLDLCKPHVLPPLTECSEVEKEALLQKISSHPNLSTLKQKFN